MHDLDFIVPSALVDPSLAADLLRDQALPNLTRVLVHGTARDGFEPGGDPSPTTWQAWVFGARADVDVGRINIAELWATAHGRPPAAGGGRYLAEPAHFTIANDHLRLDDPRDLRITLVEARALAAAIEPVLVEAGWRLEPIEPATLGHWLLTRADGAPLSGASIERAIGDNVAHWQPRSPVVTAGADAALAWRRCVNEIQMLWFGHPVNDAREAAGLPTINTLWMSGNGAPPTPLPRYAAVASSMALLAALPVEATAPRMLESFDAFVDVARRDDWSGWREQLAALDRRIGELLHRQADASLGTITLVFCGRDRAKVVVLARGDARRFWRAWTRKPSLVDLFGDGTSA